VKAWLQQAGAAAPRLSREQSDTLLLLAVIALVAVPHFGHLPHWSVALSMALLAWRAWLAITLRPLPSRLVLFVLLAACLIGTWLSFRTIAGREPGVTLAMMLLALKTLELRARRDAMVIFFLGFFAVLTHFLFSQSLLTAVLMVLAVIGLLTALVGAHMPVGRPPLRLRLSLAARMLVLGTPLAAALFLFFPRLASPLWGMPDELRATTGLSDRMTVGNVAEVALSEDIVARVQFDGEPPAAAQLYFRGPVLSNFDGRQWTVLAPRFAPRGLQTRELRPQGPAVRYTVTLEPQRKPWLLLLNIPAEPPELPGNPVRLTAELQPVAARVITERVRYAAQSYPLAQHGPLQPRLALQDDLELPPGFNPRTLAYAAQLRRDPRFADADASTLAAELLRQIRSQNFSYTLAPGPYGRDGVDEFWFDRREGFCEHFAQAFVVLMRALDVPARIVTGYQGAEYNAFDNTYIIRQSHAHAWAEYWQPGRGWLRADPTAAVAPERINTLNRTLSRQRGLFGVQAFATFNADWLARLRLGWDAVNNAWNQWVLQYTAERQFNLLRQLGLKDPDWATLAVTMLLAAGAAAGLIGAWLAFDRDALRARRDPWRRLFQRARRLLARQGIASSAADAPRRLSERIGHLPQAQDWRAFLLALEALRYAPLPQGAAHARYSQLKAQLKRLAR
jgi:transglutaminase-like putative cysteine protease